MWWKFWTWGRVDRQQLELDRHKNARGSQPDRNASGSAESEDILGSISALIGDSPVEPMESERKARSTAALESSVSLESVQEIQTTQSFDTIDLEKIQSAGRNPKLDPIPKPTTPAATDPSPTKASNPPPAKHKEFRSKDSGQTLVADDGKWVAIRGMFDGAQNPNDTDDDDDATGPSPYQTIVPSDD